MQENQSYLERSFDEILFEGRNQQYGSFVLRKIIPKHTRTGLLITTGIVLIGIAINRISWGTNEPPAMPMYGFSEVSLSEPPPILDILPPAAPALAPATAEVPAEMEVKKDTEVTDPKDLTMQDQKGDSTSTGTSTSGDAISSVVSGNGKTIYKSLEEMPAYPGGTKGIQRYLTDNLKYPDIAKQNNITGTVMVIFVVNEDGSVSDVRVEKGIGGGCDQEAVRVVEAMKRWKPGKQGGKPEACYMKMPITFRLEDN